MLAAIHTSLNGWDVVVALLVCLVVVIIDAVVGRRAPAPTPAPHPYAWWGSWLPIVTLFAVVMFGLAVTVRW